MDTTWLTKEDKTSNEVSRLNRMSWLRSHKVRFLSTAVFIGLSVSSWLGWGVLSSFAAGSQNVGVKMYILYPPNAVTDLKATPVGIQDGDVQLTWTAPANKNGAKVISYRIHFA